ncbi:MAG: 50S ribosomal protein L3 N(5)-glutamine methyltransferase, partial [Gammaproteobacteria bacterium]|nr:50S ribosomal protein L3 N(5)-glutamine methyltransferase [Gammaproteobacteria bacterium]
MPCCGTTCCRAMKARAAALSSLTALAGAAAVSDGRDGTMSLMHKLSHRPAAHRPAVRLAANRRPIVIEALRRATRRLERAGVFFGHGTANAADDASALLFHVLGDAASAAALAAGPKRAEAFWHRRLLLKERLAFEALLELRISMRCPAVYLTGKTWFAGLPMRTDPRALIPRSPLAELIERQFRPWIDPARVRRVLDLCTGGGCIALACAHYLPAAKVEATDISDPALALARENARSLGLSRRVRFTKSDHFAALGKRRYDIIVTNPPYVGERELRLLPPEYGHEPRMALAAGKQGLDSVLVILREAAQHLASGGLLVV